MCLTHSTGFSNFWFIEPDHKLHIHFEPGTQLQLFRRRFHPAAIRHRTRPQGARTGARYRRSDQGQFRSAGHDPHQPGWHNDFAGNFADGWNDQGQPQDHDKRSKPRAAGSMNTTISDLAKFAAALVRGDGLSAASRAEMTKPQLHITTAHQFPLFGRRPAGESSSARICMPAWASSSSMARRVTAFTKVVMMARRPIRWSAWKPASAVLSFCRMMSAAKRASPI